MFTTSPLRVAHVVASFPPATFHGGPIASTSGLCEALAHRGSSVRVLTTDSDGPRRVSVTLDEWHSCAGLEVMYCHSVTDRPFSPGLLRGLPSLVRWAEVVHVTGVFEHHTIPALAACRAYGRPVVWSPRGSLQRWGRVRRRRAKDVWERICRAVLPVSTVIHTTSQAEADAVRTRLPELRVVIVPNGVELPATVPEPSSSEELRLLFVGRLHPIKALDRLLEACHLLSRRGFKAWRLTVAGAGEEAYETSLRQLATNLGIARHVEFIGHVSGAERAILLRDADALVLPSFSENFGMAVAEALAHGRPVIASKGTPWQGMVDRRCGLWVENTPAALASAIMELSRRDRATMGRMGSQWMAESFSWPAVADEMLRVYRSLLEPNH